jgi:hypothetical protein
MNFPGFSAEGSLYGSKMSYQMVNSPNSRLQVTPALRIGPGGGLGQGLSCTGICAKKANECTDKCPFGPDGDICRDKCDDVFWSCMAGCRPFYGGGGFFMA